MRTVNAQLGPRKYVDKLAHCLTFLQQTGLDPTERVAVAMILLVVLLRDTANLQHGGKPELMRAALKDFATKMEMYL